MHKWETSAGDFVRPASLATVYGVLNDHENTLKWLQRAYADRDGMLAYMAHDYVIDTVRSDPQVKAIFGKIGLP